jgi:hypothetical protein
MRSWTGQWRARGGFCAQLPGWGSLSTPVIASGACDVVDATVQELSP